ncbi:MAG: septum formation protein Maf [Ruminococcus sp.]|uniref:Maf family protein n=1 Tax=Ruminococcus sp. TaxID=41978 RepID=UPI001B4D9A4E|nr:Maf family protein [Ruminococcus sp.]MBO4493550.1 septum formation protein Maf [Ruminococcus sp.]MBP5432091.1 septum formation protein Maf [Ruminococcus sp.]
MKIILASASPRRRELMRYITEDFEAVSTDCDETLPDGTDPSVASEFLAVLKARVAAEKYPDCIVIGCDTTVILGKEILGKPKDRAQCVADISKLSGKTHQVITGCCIISGGSETSFSEVTDVTFRKLSTNEVEAYAATDEPYDKAGGYGIQGLGSTLISHIEGDFFNVVGLPVGRLFNELKRVL